MATGIELTQIIVFANMQPRRNRFTEKITTFASVITI